MLTMKFIKRWKFLNLRYIVFHTLGSGLSMSSDDGEHADITVFSNVVSSGEFFLKFNKDSFNNHTQVVSA